MTYLIQTIPLVFQKLEREIKRERVIQRLTTDNLVLREKECLSKKN